MNNINKQTFVCIDCETTGLDAKESRIIEVAAMRFNLNEVLETFESLVNPEVPIPESSIAIHHITEEMIKDQPTITQLIPRLLNFVGRDIIIGHGIGFDVELIANAADRAGIPHMLRSNRLLCTLRMARHYGDSPINSLEQLRRHFNIQFEGPHRAMSDVIVNVEVFKFLAKFYNTTEELFEVLSRPIKMKIMPLGKHKGRPLTEVPLDFLLWAANKEFDQDLLFSIRSEINRRKKGNLFSQSTNPFSQL